MRFSTRAFLCSFLPFALLLTVSFVLIRQSVMNTVRDGLRSSLRESHASIARIQAQNDLHNNRLLRALGENAALKAGLKIVALDSREETARLTLVDQLRELAETQGFELLIVSGADGKQIGGVLHSGDDWTPIDGELPPSFHAAISGSGFLSLRNRTFQLSSAPVNLGDDFLGILTVGELLDFSGFSAPAVLSSHGKVVYSTLPNATPREVEAALASCPPSAECDLHIGAINFLSLPVTGIDLGDGFALRSFQDLDAANGPVHSVLSRIFLITGIAALAAALVISALSTRSIVKPLAEVVGCLRESEKTHVLPEFTNAGSTVPEIRELTASFNHAAAAIREGRNLLHRVYFGFIASLANALDARDPYTAGHCQRVSDMAVATATILELPDPELEVIRIGALLHDIGKIGVPDEVLRKPTSLSAEEFDLIKQHCVIGRQILEPVGGFDDYIPIVELHHENWDGSGYPHGLKGVEVPIGARIVHVVDAFDAMTSNRPYRRGLSRQRAIEQLRQCSGTQFDARVVEAFLLTPVCQEVESGTRSVQNLAAAIGNSQSANVAATEVHP